MSSAVHLPPNGSPGTIERPRHALAAAGPTFSSIRTHDVASPTGTFRNQTVCGGRNVPYPLPNRRIVEVSTLLTPHDRYH